MSRKRQTNTSSFEFVSMSCDVPPGRSRAKTIVLSTDVTSKAKKSRIDNESEEELDDVKDFENLPDFPLSNSPSPPPPKEALDFDRLQGMFDQLREDMRDTINSRMRDLTETTNTRLRDLQTTMTTKMKVLETELNSVKKSLEASRAENKYLLKHIKGGTKDFTPLLILPMSQETISNLENAAEDSVMFQTWIKCLKERKPSYFKVSLSTLFTDEVFRTYTWQGNKQNSAKKSIKQSRVFLAMNAIWFENDFDRMKPFINCEWQKCRNRMNVRNKRNRSRLMVANAPQDQEEDEDSQEAVIPKVEEKRDPLNL